MWLFATSIFLLILISVVGWMLYSQQSDKINTLESRITNPSTKADKEAEAIQTDKFQTVFLSNETNGSAYFGKLSKVNETTYKLADVYYLNTTGGLVKLGDEAHKPQDVMYINKANVSFWENLKDEKQFGGQLK